MTGKRNVKTNLNKNNEKEHTIISHTVIADMFNKKYDNFATPVESPTTQEPKECTRKIDSKDDIKFAFLANVTGLFPKVGYLKHNEVVGIDGVSAKCRKLHSR